MASKPRAFVLDTWAIISYYEDEPAGEQVSRLVSEANENGTPLWMSVINAGEVWYVVARRTSPAEADTAINDLRRLGIRFEDAEWNICRQAGIFKSKHKMSYSDAYAASLAIQKNAHLVTGDQDFRQIANDVKILWLSNS